MKRYETYKDSGIEWLGTIPEHWKVYRTKNIVSLINERAIDPALKKVALENIESGTGKYLETDSEYEGEGIMFHKDDILFGKLRPYLAKVYKAEFEGQSVGDIYVFRGKEGTNPDFLKYMLISDLFISVVDGSTYGAKMPRANWGFISNLKIAIPCLEEQTQIAYYLDYTVGKIDCLIFAKEKQVEDLQQYRSSIISEAVTRGIHPEVEFKDSGIDWLGCIPNKWTIATIGRLFNIKAGGDAKPELYSEIKDDTHPYPVFTNAKEKGQIYAYTSEAPFSGNSITVTGRGEVGHAIFRDESFDAIIRLLVLHPKSNNQIDSRYYAYFIDEAIHFFTDSAAVGQLSALQISPYEIAVPSYKEQQEIADYLDEKTSKIDSAIKELKTQINDLRQYKKSVISEAVTGKVDLRDWKPK